MDEMNRLKKELKHEIAKCIDHSFEKIATFEEENLNCCLEELSIKEKLQYYLKILRKK